MATPLRDAVPGTETMRWERGLRGSGQVIPTDPRPSHSGTGSANQARKLMHALPRGQVGDIRGRAHILEVRVTLNPERQGVIRVRDIAHIMIRGVPLHEARERARVVDEMDDLTSLAHGTERLKRTRCVPHLVWPDVGLFPRLKLGRDLSSRDMLGCVPGLRPVHLTHEGSQTAHSDHRLLIEARIRPNEDWRACV